MIKNTKGAFVNDFDGFVKEYLKTSEEVIFSKSNEIRPFFFMEYLKKDLEK